MIEQASISFVLDGKVVSVDCHDPSGPTPTTTVLNYLRSLPGHTGVKEGCAEGDCGACTVVVADSSDGTLSYQAVDSCLVFLPMIHGKYLVTVENLKNTDGSLHPVQQAMVATGGSQCGYCTPGIIMSLFSLYKMKDHPERTEIDDCLTGNLCRCTGYKPIVEAASRACVHKTVDHFTRQEAEMRRLLETIPQRGMSVSSDEQKYWRPITVEEALAIKAGHTDALVICGATDVALRVTKRHEVLPKILDVGAIKALRRIEPTSTGVRIGGSASLTAIKDALGKEFPALATMLEVFGSRQIRNLATLGGNLATASPIGDLLPVLMAYGAGIHVRSVRGERSIPMDEFIVGYRKTALRPDELIVSIEIASAAKDDVVKAYKISKRKDLDISTVSGAFRLGRTNGTVSRVVIAFGGMAEVTRRAIKTEAFLKGKPWIRRNVEEAMDVLDTEFRPITDARSGATFRKIAAKNLLLKFWSETTR